MDTFTREHLRPELTGVESTALITLWARAREASRDQPAFVDQEAVRLRDQLDFDWRLFEKGKLTQIGVRLRTLKFDEIATQFLSRFPNGTVIELGAGLNTRRTRVNGSLDQWLEVDTEPLVALRRHLFGEVENERLIVGSFFENDWLERVKEISEPPYLILLEGVLMYFRPEQVQLGLRQIFTGLPDSVLLFDVLGKSAIRFQRRHDLYTQLNSQFYWGINGPEGLVEIDEGWTDSEVMNLREVLHRYRREANERIVWLSRSLLSVVRPAAKLYHYVLLRSPRASQALQNIKLNPVGGRNGKS